MTIKMTAIIFLIALNPLLIITLKISSVTFSLLKILTILFNVKSFRQLKTWILSTKRQDALIHPASRIFCNPLPKFTLFNTSRWHHATLTSLKYYIPYFYRIIHEKLIHLLWACITQFSSHENSHFNCINGYMLHQLPECTGYH